MTFEFQWEDPNKNLFLFTIFNENVASNQIIIYISPEEILELSKSVKFHQYTLMERF